MKNRLLAPVITAALSFGAAAQAQVPSYIQAKPEAVAKAFGAAIARKIFSDAYTALRRDKVLASTKRVPGFRLPGRSATRAGRDFALADPARRGVLHAAPAVRRTWR